MVAELEFGVIHGTQYAAFDKPPFLEAPVRTM